MKRSHYLGYGRFSRSGFSLVEILIALGVMSVVAMGLISLLTNQNNEVKAIGDKMLSKSVETQLKNVLMNSSYCNCLFRNFTVDSTPIPAVWNAFPASIPSGFAQPPPLAPAPCVGVAGMIIPTVGTAFPNSSVKVAAINMSNITYQGAGYYTGSLDISFNGGVGGRSLKNILIPLAFSVNMLDPVNARTFVGCGAAPVTSGYIFLDPVTLVSSTPDGIQNAGWQTYNLGALVPPGTTTVILETELENYWRVAGITAKFRKNAATTANGELWLGKSMDDDSKGANIGQGIFPIDTVSNSFDFRVDIGGDGGGWNIKLIGYIAP